VRAGHRRRRGRDAPRPPIWSIVTADCVPVLAATARRPRGVCDPRGLARPRGGVIEAGIDALRREAPRQALRAVIGPTSGRCCYEIDAPVLDALRHFDADLDAATSTPARTSLAGSRRARAQRMLRAGVSPRAIGRSNIACTSCDAQRFHSYRRDGARAGRLVHWVAARILDSAGSDA
jgi:copper oxidase (laccase) domain-containing protein